MTAFNPSRHIRVAPLTGKGRDVFVKDKDLTPYYTRIWKRLVPQQLDNRPGHPLRQDTGRKNPADIKEKNTLIAGAVTA